jgi:hypothetical protein
MRVPQTSEILRKWEPRIGRVAARRFAVAIWANFLIFPIGVFLFITIGLATTLNSYGLGVLGVAIFVVGLVNASLIWFAPVAARRAASRTLGIPLTRKNYPPNHETAYRRWCDTNQVRPDGAMGNGAVAD